MLAIQFSIPHIYMVIIKYKIQERMLNKDLRNMQMSKNTKQSTVRVRRRASHYFHSIGLVTKLKKT